MGTVCSATSVVAFPVAFMVWGIPLAVWEGSAIEQTPVQNGVRRLAHGLEQADLCFDSLFSYRLRYHLKADRHER